MQRNASLTGAVLIVLAFGITPAGAQVTREPTPAPTPTPTPTQTSMPVAANPSGHYASAESNLRIAVRPDGIGEVESTSGWSAVGFFRERKFVGLMRELDDLGNSIPGVAYGTIQFTLRDDGAIDAVLTPRSGGLRQDEHWRPKPKEPIAPPKRLDVRVTPPSTDEPSFGEYVYVEELPEAIHKVPPVYPPGMRSSGIEGTIMIQALVGKDGLVTDTRVVKSIRDGTPTPEFDAAAIECVRQWRFKPALSKDAPVAVWVAVPIRFSLH